MTAATIDSSNADSEPPPLPKPACYSGEIWAPPSELRRNRVWFEAPADFFFVDHPEVARMGVVFRSAGRVWGFVRLRSRQRLAFFHSLLPDVPIGDATLYAVRRTDPRPWFICDAPPWCASAWAATELVLEQATGVSRARGLV